MGAMSSTQWWLVVLRKQYPVSSFQFLDFPFALSQSQPLVFNFNFPSLFRSAISTLIPNSTL